MTERMTDFVVQFRQPDGSPWTDYGAHETLGAAERFIELRTADPDCEWRVMRRTWTQVAYVGRGTDLQSREAERRAYKREWARNKRAELKAEGRCVGCGKPVSQGTLEAEKSGDAGGQGTPKRRGRGRPRTRYRCDLCIAKEEARKDARAAGATA